MVKVSKTDKGLEHEEFLRIRGDYIRSDGTVGFREMEKYFKSLGTPVSGVTLRKWDKALNSGERVSDFKERERFIAFCKKKMQTDAKYAVIYRDMMGWTKQQKEDDGLTPDELIRAGIAVRENLRQEYADSGSCPVCGFTKALPQPRVDTEPEHEKGGEVATVGLPA